MNKPIASSILSLFLIFFSISISISQISDFSHIDFTKADSVASLYPNHSLKDLRLLSDKLTRSLTTEVEKFRAIYKWVCDNIENDYGGYKKNKYKREKLNDHPDALKEWEIKFSSKSFQRLITRHKTVCTGYAYLVRELSYFAGISCEIIHGYGRNAESNIGGVGIPNHSWNAVQLNGKWYLCDPTWSSGAIHLKDIKFIPHFNEEYFLPKPSIFAMNHYPLDKTWLLMEDKKTLDKFLNGPLVYKGAYKYGISPIYPETFEVELLKGERITFQFKSPKSLTSEELILKVIRDGFTIDKEATIKDNSLFYEHIFNKRGTYVVHLLVKSDYVITYEIKVK